MTLLAPNNEAMEAATLPENNVELENLLKYHAVAQLVNSNDMTDELVVNSTAGKLIRFNSYNGGSVSFEFLSLTTHGGLRKPVVAVVDPGAMMILAVFIQILDSQMVHFIMYSFSFVQVGFLQL